MVFPYDWSKDIKPNLANITPVSGGYTTAQRGIVNLADRRKVFVKIATDELTRKWLKKEIIVYKKLNKTDYKHIPEMLACNNDQSALALEYLESASFVNTWDAHKLTAVMNAHDELKKYIDLFRDDPTFKSGDVVLHDLKWPKLKIAKNIDTINHKVKKLGINARFTTHQINRLAELHNDWSLKEDTLIHEDIRADNFGYNANTKTGKLIDWNWLCIGDESLDITALFINVRLSGYDPYRDYPEKFDKQMIAYLISFWLDSILDGNEDSSRREWDMRVSQAKNLEECIKLLKEYG
jgi:thiamine kinase-like enzyme